MVVLVAAWLLLCEVWWVLPYYIPYLVGPISLFLFILACLTALIATRRLWRSIGYGLTAGVLSATAMMLLVFFVTPQVKLSTAAFAIKMRLTADVPAIRHWAESPGELSPNTAASLHDDGRLSVRREDWPECIRTLDPVYVFLTPETGEASLVWGSGFGHWGITVVQNPSTQDAGNGVDFAKGAFAWWRE